MTYRSKRIDIEEDIVTRVQKSVYSFHFNIFVDRRKRINYAWTYSFMLKWNLHFYDIWRKDYQNSWKCSKLLASYYRRTKFRFQTCIDTIGKYISNILEHSDDPKYRKIKMSNKAFQVWLLQFQETLFDFQERIAACRGGMAFLKTIGFEEKQEAPEGVCQNLEDL